jgi:lipopolysaccharide biosynthesis regulator YciM
MIDLVWLLLPIAAGCGWLAAKYRGIRLKFNHTFSSSDYFKGLNYFLNEQSDKVLDTFIQLTDLNNETIETHLALGALFRRRGEVEKAICIHQHLITRSKLSAHQRDLAMLELGQDYYRAGLLDRAELLFLQLTHASQHQIEAHRQLLDIYQQERDWESAIKTARNLAKISGHAMHTVIAQYYCEQAKHFKQKNQPEIALSLIQSALTVDPNCVRASLLEAYIAIEQQNWQAAISAFKRVEQQNLDYLPEIIESLQHCYQQLGQPEAFIDYLRYVLTKQKNVYLTLELAKIIRQQNGGQQAADFILEKLRQHPSLPGIDYLLDLMLSKATNITHEHLKLLKNMTAQLLRDKPVYSCDGCGFSSKNLHWQCPSCKQWNTFKPFQNIYHS